MVIESADLWVSAGSVFGLVELETARFITSMPQSGCNEHQAAETVVRTADGSADGMWIHVTH